MAKVEDTGGSAPAPGGGAADAGSAGNPERCRNCEAPLAGPYCSSCGQRVRGSARSMGTLLLEARDSLVHLDGRLWQTLQALALRPGFLTLEYFRERRARYVSPFRLYLAASLVFFSLAFVSGRPEGTALDEEDRAEARRELAEAAAELRANPAVPPAALRALEEAERRAELAAPGEPV